MPAVMIVLDEHEQDANPTFGRDAVVIFTGNVTIQKMGTTLPCTTTITATVDKGWETQVPSSSYSSNSQNTWFTFIVYVFVPYEAPSFEDGMVIITATTTYGASPVGVRASDFGIIHVMPYAWASLHTAPNSVKVKAGETGEAEGWVDNVGNTNATFEVSVAKAPSGIDVELSQTSFRLPMGETELFDMDISVGAGVPPAQHTISLQARKTAPADCGPFQTTNDFIVNTNPVEASLTAEPLTVAPGMEVTFDGSDSTVGTGSPRFLFDFGDGEDSGWLTTASTKHAYAKEGEYTARLTVEGAGGVRSTNDASVEVTVTLEGFKPTAEIVDVSPNPAHEGEEVTLTGRGQPVQGTSIRKYEWRSDTDGGLGSLALVVVEDLTRGEHTITFRVQDGRGVWSETASEKLVVLPSRESWEVEVLRPKKREDVSGSTYTIRGTASFGAVAVDRVEVRVDEGTWMTAQGGAEWTYVLDLTDLGDGEHKLEVRAQAQGSTSDVVSVIFTKGADTTSDGILLGLTAVQLGAIVLLVLVAIGLGALVRRRARAHAL